MLIKMNFSVNYTQPQDAKCTEENDLLFNF